MVHDSALGARLVIRAAVPVTGAVRGPGPPPFRISFARERVKPSWARAAMRGIGATIAEVFARDGADIICIDIPGASARDHG